MSRRNLEARQSERSRVRWGFREFIPFSIPRQQLDYHRPPETAPVQDLIRFTKHRAQYRPREPGIFVAALAETDDTGPRTGRCRRIGRACGACVSGRTRPCVGEAIRVTLRSDAWDYMIVTAIVDGEPGRWLVLTAWPKARERCSNAWDAARLSPSAS